MGLLVVRKLSTSLQEHGQNLNHLCFSVRPSPRPFPVIRYSACGQVARSNRNHYTPITWTNISNQLFCWIYLDNWHHLMYTWVCMIAHKTMTCAIKPLFLLLWQSERGKIFSKLDLCVWHKEGGNVLKCHFVKYSHLKAMKFKVKCRTKLCQTTLTLSPASLALNPSIHKEMTAITTRQVKPSVSCEFSQELWWLRTS